MAITPRVTYKVVAIEYSKPDWDAHGITWVKANLSCNHKLSFSAQRTIIGDKPEAIIDNPEWQFNCKKCESDEYIKKNMEFV